jgi:hypothetical protein
MDMRLRMRMRMMKEKERKRYETSQRSGGEGNREGECKHVD